MRNLIYIFGLLIPVIGSAQHYSIDRYKVSGGGCTSTGGIFAVTGTTGQPDAGAMAGGGGSLTGGFWGLIAAVQTPGAPILSVTRSDTSVVVAWPFPSSGWTLQQNSDLASSNGWQTSIFPVSNNGIISSVTLSAPAGNLFFRLSAR